MSEASGVAGRLPAQNIGESACQLTGCSQPELLVVVVFLLGTVLTVALTGAVLRRLDEARDAIERERERASAERDAFDEFARRIQTLDPTPRSDGGMVRPDTVAGPPGPPDELAPVRRAYEETVMAVPHHGEEFGETLVEGMAAEFSPEVAATVANGGRLTPGVRSVLLQGARQASEQRARILDALRTEQEELADAEETLRPATAAAETARDRVQTAPPTTLVAEADRLDYHERTVESMLADRQQSIHEVDRDPWFEYVYAPLDSPFPVLSAGTETLDRLSTARDALARALSS